MTLGRRSRVRRRSRGVSSRTMLAGRSRAGLLGLLARPACRPSSSALLSGGHLRAAADLAVAPALGQQVVEQVVDGDGAEQPALVVDDGCGHQVVRRQEIGDVLEGRLGPQVARSRCRARRRPATRAARGAAAGCGRRRAACRSGSPAAGGTTYTRAASDGVQLLVADVGQRLGDGGVGGQDHRLRRHHAAGGLLAVGHQPPDVLGLLRLHQLQQLAGGLGRRGRRSGRRRRRRTSPRGCRRRARSRGARGSRPGPPRAAPRGRRRAARRRARRPPRCGARAAGRGSRSRRRPAGGPPARRPGARRPGRPGCWPGPRRRRHSTTWVWPRRRKPLVGSWIATRESTQSRVRACSIATSNTTPCDLGAADGDLPVEHLPDHEGLGGALLEPAHVEQPGGDHLAGVDAGDPGHRREDLAPAEHLDHQPDDAWLETSEDAPGRITTTTSRTLPTWSPWGSNTGSPARRAAKTRVGVVLTRGNSRWARPPGLAHLVVGGGLTGGPGRDARVS